MYDRDEFLFLTLAVVFGLGAIACLGRFLFTGEWQFFAVAIIAFAVSYAASDEI